MSLISYRRKIRNLLFLLPLTITNDAWAWNASLGADLSSPFVQGDPSMSFSGSVSNDFSKKWGLSLSQGIEKNFYVDSATKEFELSDTVFALNLYPRTLIPNVNWSLRLQASLPTSQISQTNEVYSKPEARLNASIPLYEGVTLGFNGFMRMTLSRYDTTPTQNGVGGAPLPALSYGVGHNGNWNFFPDWILSYGMSYTEIIYHDVQYEGGGDPSLYSQPDQAYSLSIALNYEWTPEHSFSGSYSYGGLLLQPGIDDYVLYDQEDSRWSLGYAYSF